MKCKEIHKQINPYLNGALDVVQSKSFESHLEECTSCRLLLANVTATMSSIENREILQPNPFLFTRISQEIENRANKSPVAGLQRILQPIAIVAILAVGIYMGIGLGNSYVYVEDEYASSEIESIVDGFLFDDMKYESIEIFLMNE